MSQNDFVIANASGASVRADMNSAFQALASASAGATAPSTPYQYQYWFDTTLNIQKQRDGANTAWVNLWSLVGTTLKLYEQGTLLLARANTWTAEQTNLNGLRIGLARGHIDGLILSNNGSDATNDIDIAPGQAADGANGDDLVVASAIGKQLDVTWASGGTPGTPTGGLSSSLTPVQNDTWYHVFLGKVSGTEEVGFDTSETGANLVTDHSFTNVRRIGAVRRGTAANRLFTQVGDYVEWVTPSHDLNIATGGNATRTTFTVMTPADITVEVSGNAVCNSASTREVIIFGSEQPDRTPSSTDKDMSVRGSATQAATGIKRLAADATLAYRLDTATIDYLGFFTHGYHDPRGRE